MWPSFRSITSGLASGVARLAKLIGHSLSTNCYNKIIDCTIRVYRSFGHREGGASAPLQIHHYLSLTVTPTGNYLWLAEPHFRGEFVDFNTLSPEVKSAIAASIDPNISHSTATINSISWLDAWNIYIAIIVTHNSARASKPLGYQCLIHSASKHFTTSAWLEWDVQFCMLAASNPKIWNKCHFES